LGSVILYSERQVGLIRAAGQVVSQCLALARELAVPGGTTRQIDQAIAAHIRKCGGTSPFLGYQLPGKVPFPATVCTSVNDVVVHGLPDDVPFKEGDLVSVDCGVRLNNYIGDGAWTFAAGQPNERAKALLRAGQEALHAGIRAAQPRGKLGEISRAIQTLVEGRGFSVVRDYVGHGVGLSLHEEPNVPNYVQVGAFLPIVGKVLKPGMVLALEPMVNEGGPEVRSKDGLWPVHTADGGRSVHFEHTIAILADRIEILTLPAPEQQG
jgi:methionyl aminopeptidase